jgi:A/G-specific adenine glycosylase
VKRFVSDIKKKDLQGFRKTLINWYFENHRSLPWRITDDPFRIWVSEVMLQQTQVNTVLPYYRKFLDTFPTVSHLSQAHLQDVLKVWEGMGYYARARNLHRAAGIVQETYDGIIPNSWQAFRNLPGVGDYIAAAVLSIAYGHPYAVVDGNVKRVLARLLKIDAPVNRSNSTEKFKEAAGRLLDPKRSGTYNQAIMELGALICKPQNPLCQTCPVQPFCQACQAREVIKYPRRTASRKIPEYHIAVAVVFKNGRVLITQRKPEGLLGGLWEFPGGKIRKEETSEAACLREIQEEVNLKIKIENYLTQVKHAYTHFKIIMDVFCCKYIAGRVRLNGPVAHRWISLDKIDAYPLPKANHKFLPKLEKWVRDPGQSLPINRI